MTILEAIARVDALAPNTIAQPEKVHWLSLMDALVHRQVLQTHQGEVPDWEPYTQDTALDTRLLIAPPHEEIYIHWLKAWVHYYQGETALFNEANLLYGAAWNSYRDQVNRTRMPLGRRHNYY